MNGFDHCPVRQSKEDVAGEAWMNVPEERGSHTYGPMLHWLLPINRVTHRALQVDGIYNLAVPVE